MAADQREWTHARDELVRTLMDLGFPEELGNEIMKNGWSALDSKKVLLSVIIPSSFLLLTKNRINTIITPSWSK